MLLFVYGTLRPQFDGEMAQQLARESHWIGPARVRNAALYRVRGEEFDYPALVLLNGDEGGNDVEENYVRGEQIKNNGNKEFVEKFQLKF